MPVATFRQFVVFSPLADRRVLIAVDLCSEEPWIVIGNLPGHSGMEYLRKLREEGGKVRID